MAFSRDRKRATRAAYAAGVLLLISGSVGSTTLYRVGYAVLATWLPSFQRLLFVLFWSISILAGLGGLTVIAGGWLLHKRRTGPGKLLIAVGVGTGILGIVFQLLLAVVDQGRDPVTWLLSTGVSLSGLGVLLSLYARMIA